MLLKTNALSLAIAVAVTCGVLATSPEAAAASGIREIDCSIDLDTAAERTICRSTRLQILDAQITEVYADVMLSPRIADDVKARVRQSQLNFLERRNSCGGDRECLEEVMGGRLSRIHKHL